MESSTPLQAKSHKSKSSHCYKVVLIV